MGQLETKWGKSWDAHQFTNPGMHADFRIPTCAPIPASRDASPIRLLRLPSPVSLDALLSRLLCSPSPGFCEMRTQSRDVHRIPANFPIPGCTPIPCPGTLRRAGYSARQVPGFAGCTPISESRDACHSRVLRNAHPILGCAPNPSQFPNLGMRANSRVPGRFAKQVTPLAKSRVLRDAHQFPNPGMRADFILFFFTGIIVPNWTLSKIGKTNQSPSCFRLPREMKISYLLSKMLQVIFIGINETRQGAQNKKKWSSFSAIGTSISSDAPIPVSRDASPSRLLRSPSPGFCGMRTNFRIPGCVKISYLLSKMLQVIFIGINETRQGAQNKKKWSSFSAIGTSISSVHVS